MATTKTDAPDAITLLKADHKAVSELLERLEDAATGGERRDLVERIEKELTVHAAIEEEIFYPAFKAAAEGEEDEELFFEAADEHELVKETLQKLSRSDPATPQYAARCKVLGDLVKHHVEEEEGELFPCAKKRMEREQLEDLGRRLQERKSELQSRSAGGSRGKPRRA
jgi:hemerythrin superfamily protein